MPTELYTHPLSKLLYEKYILRKTIADRTVLILKQSYTLQTFITRAHIQIHTV